MGSSGRSVSTVSAGGWSNAGCKTNRGFRVNINYYLREGMNGGGVSVGRRWWWWWWWHRRPGTRKPGTMYVYAVTQKTLRTRERSSDRICRSGGTRRGYILSAGGGLGARRFYIIVTCRARVHIDRSAAVSSVRNSGACYCYGVEVPTTSEGGETGRADGGAPSVRVTAKTSRRTTRRRAA